jgi:hypothetical protein
VIRRGALACAVIAGLAIFSASAARSDFREKGANNEPAVLAGEGKPQNLWVVGGEENWHAGQSFRVDWTNPPPPGETPIVAVRYHVRNAANAVVVADTRIGWATTLIERIEVPDVPGIYTAEIWLEDGAGKQWSPATAQLRFDNVRPASVEPLAPPGWIGRTALPYLVRLTHPTEPLPQSGIRGYAVTHDADPSRAPCDGGDLCSDAETSLHGGIEDSALSLADLPEGTTYVHAVAVSGSGLKSAGAGSAALHVDTTDPVTTLAGAPGGWTNRPVALTATASDALSGMRATGSHGPFTAIRVDDLTPTSALGSSVGTTLIGEGVHSIAYYARDAAGNVNDGGYGNGVENRQPSTTTVRIDRSSPSAAFVNAQSPEEPELIEARISDSLSGPDPAKGRIALRRSGSGAPFEPLPTETAGGKLRAHWDSDAYPAGEYEFQATGYDAAGNAVTTERRANGAGMVLPNPLKVPTAIQIGFGGKVLIWHRCERHGGRRHCRREVIHGFDRRPSLRFVPYGRGALFGGRLTGGLGSPLAGMPMQVIERFGSGSGESERVTTVRTEAGGIFTAHLAPGPSREVSASFAGTRALTRSGGKSVRLGVRGDVRMRASATIARIGGRPIVFRGRVEADGAAVPDGGKAIQLQFRLPGLPWTEFRTVQTDRTGHFHYAYSFTDDDSRGVRFEFRAFAPAQSGWPYEPAGSRPVSVRGL